MEGKRRGLNTEKHEFRIMVKHVRRGQFELYTAHIAETSAERDTSKTNWHEKCVV